MIARTLLELRDARITLGISQSALARELGCSQSTLWRLEAHASDEVTVIRLSEMASLLGLELAITLHPIGDPIRDRGQQGVAKRFRALLAPVWRVTAELLLPNPGDLRSWDLFLRLDPPVDGGRVGVDLETRVRDIQALVRRTRGRERDGGADQIVIVLSDSSTNRQLAPELREALGAAYATSPRRLLAELRAGRPLTGSGVILI